MAILTINTPIDTRNIDIFKFFKAIKVAPNTESNGQLGYKANFGKNSYVQISGTGFSYMQSGGSVTPISGILNSMSLVLNNVEAYTLSGIKIRQMDILIAYLKQTPAKVTASIFSGADTIIGSKFDDKLTGYGGSDTLQGNGGNDTYYVDGKADRVLEKVGEGTKDTVLTTGDYVLALKQEVEFLAAADPTGKQGLSLVGNEFANTITGNAGNNRFDGKAGADVMTGLAGNDIYYVDDAADQVVESAADKGIDSILTTVSYALAAGQAVEQMFVLARNKTESIDLTGNEFRQSIKGNNGDNVINGGGGSKTGSGADVLYGFGGKDTFVFDSAILTTKGAVIANNDAHLADFSVIDDAIKLAKSVFSGLTADTKGVLIADQFKDIGKLGAKVDASDRVLYDSKSGALYYDKDGSGSAAAIKFATIETFKTQVDAKGVSTVSHLDFLIG